MANVELRGKIDEARRAGYSDREIAEHLVATGLPELQKAQEAGYAPYEVWEHLGLKTAPKLSKKELQKLYDEAGVTVGIDPELLKAIAQQESSEDPNALGAETKWGRARGIMQLLPETVQALGVKDPYDPREAIPAAAKLMKENLKLADGDMSRALMMYHGGTDPSNWGPKTEAYQGKVFEKYYKNLEPILGKGDPLEQGIQSKLTDITGRSKAPMDQSTPAAPEIAAEPAPQRGDFNWTLGDSIANGMLLGFVPEITAAGRAMRGQGSYNDLLQGINASRVAYGEANPLSHAAGEIGGSLPPTILGTMAGGAGLAAGGARLAGAMPAVAPAINAATRFALGQAGQAPGAGNALLRMASGAAAGLGQGAAAGALTAGLGEGSVAEQAETGGKIGAAIGGVLPALGTAGRAIARIPNFLQRETAELADWAGRQGIGLGTKQIAGQAVARTAKQEEQFTRALSRTFGEDTANLTASVMGAADKRLGQTFDKLAQRTTVMLDGPLLNDLIAIEKSIAASPNEVKPAQKVLDTVLDAMVSKGWLDGKAFQALTQKGSPLEKLRYAQNPENKVYGGQIREALEDALERSATKLGDKKLVEEIRTARTQYKNFMIAKKLLERAGPEGRVDPSRVLALATKRGASGDMNKLAQIGNSFLGTTPDRTGAGLIESTIRHPLWMGGGGIGAGTLLYHFPQQTLTGAGLAGTALGGALLAKAYANSPSVRNALIRRSLQGQSVLPMPGVIAATGAANRQD